MALVQPECLSILPTAQNEKCLLGKSVVLGESTRCWLGLQNADCWQVCSLFTKKSCDELSCLKLSDWTNVHLSRLSYCFWDCDWKMAFAYHRTFLSQFILLLVDQIFNRLIDRHSDLSTYRNCSMNLKCLMDILIEFYLYRHRGFLDLLRCVYIVDHCRCCFVFFFYGMAVVKRWKEIVFPPRGM